MIGPQYLGDGVYATAEEDGSLVLTTGTHVYQEAGNIIILEPEVLTFLDQYRKRAREEK
jgi:hypothetical protein